jgi:hypothetical protein
MYVLCLQEKFKQLLNFLFKKIEDNIEYQNYLEGEINSKEEKITPQMSLTPMKSNNGDNNKNKRRNKSHKGSFGESWQNTRKSLSMLLSTDSSSECSSASLVPVSSSFSFSLDNDDSSLSQSTERLCYAAVEEDRGGGHLSSLSDSPPELVGGRGKGGFLPTHMHNDINFRPMVGKWTSYNDELALSSTDEGDSVTVRRGTPSPLLFKEIADLKLANSLLLKENKRLLALRDLELSSIKRATEALSDRLIELNLNYVHF